jgi:hypothetical protein
VSTFRGLAFSLRVQFIGYSIDIDQSREHLNIHFRQNLREDGTPETYGETFDRLLSSGAVSEKWLKPDSKLVDELVFDVNTDYFEQRGGYDYAVQFFTEAYRLAVKEVGSEDYILSAVLHADERNKALSEQLGRDVYHYHLHVVYVPVVQKEVYYQKTNKNLELAGKLKEVIPQISHSKKWPKIKTDKGLVNSYSLLQDRFYEGMVAAGFDGFERGERGSTKEHLDVLDYKIQQDEKRLDVLDKQVEKKTAQVEKLNKETAVKSSAKATIKEIDAMGKPALLGGINFTADEAAKLKSLAKKFVTLDDKIAANKKKIAALDTQISDLNSKLRDAQLEAKHWYQELQDLKERINDYLHLAAKFPARVKEFFTGLFREEQAQEQQLEQERQLQRHTKKKTYDRGL